MESKKQVDGLEEVIKEIHSESYGLSYLVVWERVANNIIWSCP